MSGGGVRWSISAIPVTRDASHRDNDTPASRIASLHHVVGRRVKDCIETMIRALVMWRDVVERPLEQTPISREALLQLDGIGVSHHRNFIGRLQTQYRVVRSPAHLLAERIQTTTAID